MGFDLPFSGTLNPTKSSRKLSEPSLRRDVRFYDVMPASCIIDTIYRLYFTIDSLKIVVGTYFWLHIDENSHTKVFEYGKFIGLVEEKQICVKMRQNCHDIFS